MKKFVNQMTYVSTPGRSCEPPTDKPSKTVPGEAISVQEILRRFQSNMPITGNVKTGGYDSGVSHDSPDIEKSIQADIVDRHEMARAVREDLQERQSAADKAKQDRLAKQRQSQVEDREKAKRSLQERDADHDDAQDVNTGPRTSPAKSKGAKRTQDE